MKISFSKFQGAGNDFVLIDNRSADYKLTEEQIAFICHRRFGIGADGLMLLEASAKYDFRMKYYNSDGREGSMCGNGGRCITAFADALGIHKEEYIFEAVDGLHRARILQREQGLWDISLEMIDVEKVEWREDHYFLDTGSPHHVEFVEDVEHLDVYGKGKAIRYSEEYAPGGGTNVNFVQLEGDVMEIRTYERGVEEETLACGTGATAAAIAAAVQSGKNSGEFILKALGGNLRVSFEREGNRFRNLWLSGPAAQVFDGQIDL